MAKFRFVLIKNFFKVLDLKTFSKSFKEGLKGNLGSPY